MQIVIDIPDQKYKWIVDNPQTYTNDLYEAIRNGTPLPKHHGRLIDADELYGDFIDGTEGYDCQKWSRIDIGDIIDDVPTVIEADKEQ